MSSLMTPEKDIFDSQNGDQVGPVIINGNKIDVELLPQKRGLLIKHVEYLVSSEKYQSQVNFVLFSSHWKISAIKCRGEDR